MAVAHETSLAPQAVTFAAAGETENVSFDAGSGANRGLLVGVFWRDQSNVITGVQYAGVPMTAVAVKFTENVVWSGQLWRLAGPASGTNTIAVTMGASGGSDSQALIVAWVGNGVDPLA